MSQASVVSEVETSSVIEDRGGKKVRVVKKVIKLIGRYENGTLRDGKNLIFLDAPGGTGKTFTLNVIISYLKMNEKTVAVSATSGIAATLLYTGELVSNKYFFSYCMH